MKLDCTSRTFEVKTEQQYLGTMKYPDSWEVVYAAAAGQSSDHVYKIGTVHQTATSGTFTLTLTLTLTLPFTYRWFVSPPEMSCKSGGSWTRPAVEIANIVSEVSDCAQTLFINFVHFFI